MPKGKGGGTIPGLDEPAFDVWDSDSLPVLISAPHGGRSYPPGVTANLRHPRQTALRLEDRYVDLLAQGVAEETGAALAVARAPRAMLDLNRAVEDMDWSMVAALAPAGARHSAANRRARSGLGLIPRRVQGIGDIWRDRLRPDELQARIAGIHAPYHAALAQTLARLRDRWGAALLIDIHSMPPLAIRSGERAAPEFVIGDRFGASCARGLVGAALAFLADEGRNAAHNRPYAGGYVLDRHGAPARGIHAIQVEVCRNSYLDAALERPSLRAKGMVRLLSGLVRMLGEETAELGRTRNYPLAAE